MHLLERQQEVWEKRQQKSTFIADEDPEQYDCFGHIFGNFSYG